MSRTDLDPVTIARSLRRMAGDGSIEWVMEPMQASVLLDVADMLDENAKLREEFDKMDVWHSKELSAAMAENAKLRKLLLDVWNDAIRFDGFWDYVHDDGEIYNEGELPHYQERMRELGLEVR